MCKLPKSDQTVLQNSLSNGILKSGPKIGPKSSPKIGQSLLNCHPELLLELLGDDLVDRPLAAHHDEDGVLLVGLSSAAVSLLFSLEHGNHKVADRSNISLLSKVN